MDEGRGGKGLPVIRQMSVRSIGQKSFLDAVFKESSNLKQEIGTVRSVLRENCEKKEEKEGRTLLRKVKAVYQEDVRCEL